MKTKQKSTKHLSKTYPNSTQNQLNINERLPKINKNSTENNEAKPFKNQSQIDQESMENQPKVDPTSIKHRTKIEQTSTRSEKCRALRLGSRLGGVLEASWARPGRVLGANIARSWRPKSNENLLKKNAKNRSKHRCLPSGSVNAILVHF